MQNSSKSNILFAKKASRVQTFQRDYRRSLNIPYKNKAPYIFYNVGHYYLKCYLENSDISLYFLEGDYP